MADPGFDFDAYWKAWVAARLDAIQRAIIASKQAQQMEARQAANPEISDPDEQHFEEEY